MSGKQIIIFLALFFCLGICAGILLERENASRVLGNFFMGLTPECKAAMGHRLDAMESIVNARRKKAGLGTVQELEEGK